MFAKLEGWDMSSAPQLEVAGTGKALQDPWEEHSTEGKENWRKIVLRIGKQHTGKRRKNKHHRF